MSEGKLQVGVEPTTSGLEDQRASIAPQKQFALNWD